MLNFIRTTSTQTGLAVTAYLDRKEHPTGLKPDRNLISALHFKHSDTLPKWNFAGTVSDIGLAIFPTESGHLSKSRIPTIPHMRVSMLAAKLANRTYATSLSASPA